MQKNFSTSDSSIPTYLDSLLKPEDQTLSETRRYSEAQGLPSIQVGAFDARHLEVIAASVGAKKAVEIGTLGGYSGIALLRGMKSVIKSNQAISPQTKTSPESMKSESLCLYSLDCDPKHIKVATENFKHSGLLPWVNFLEGPACESLQKIEQNGPFDLVFIDADKLNYPLYLEWAEKNLRPGGVLLADNVFAWGYLNATQFPDEDTRVAVQALRVFNEKLARNQKFLTTFLPTGEGLVMAVRLPG